MEAVLDAAPCDAAGSLGAALRRLPFKAAVRSLDATFNRARVLSTASWRFRGTVICTERLKAKLKEIFSFSIRTDYETVLAGLKNLPELISSSYTGTLLWRARGAATPERERIRVTEHASD